MKVLLLKDVKGLGKAGELKEVKDGYGNNFLIGKGLAKQATNEVLRRFESDKKRQAEEEIAKLESLKNIQSQLSKITLMIKRKLGANGSLFGAITKEEIAKELEKQHKIEIDKKAIEISNAIKATGNYNLDVKLGQGIHANLEVNVEGE